MEMGKCKQCGCDYPKEYLDKNNGLCPNCQAVNERGERQR
jgi:predicted Zn-ribbon and HTH transcriptional regulator